MTPHRRAGFLTAILAVFGSPSFALAGGLVVYTYDSFLSTADDGRSLGDVLKERFAAPLRFVSVGDAAQLVSRLQLDRRRGKAVADVVLGVDALTWPKTKAFARKLAVAEFPERAALSAGVREAVPAEMDEGFVPFDEGTLAFILDTEQAPLATAPKSWADLADARWRKKLLLEDPRTSTPGLLFFAALHALSPTPAAFEARARKLRESWLTLSPSWGQAYGLFEKKQAPLVWSYVTSEAYHREHAKDAVAKDRYRALVFEEGNPRQVEGAFAVARETPSAEAVRFLRLLLSEEIQREIPKRQWMLPAREGVALPESFRGLPKPKRAIVPSPAKVDEMMAAWKKALR